MKLKLKRKREKRFIDTGKLLKALEGTSQDTPIKAPDLEIIICAVEDRTGVNRNVRTAITNLIKEGHLIGSGAKGFFMINNMVEYITYVNHLETYVRGTLNRIKWIKRAWKHQHKGKLILKLRKE